MISLVHPSPAGALTLVSNGAALTHIAFETQKHRPPATAHGSDRIIDCARRELDRYFAGRLKLFETPLAPAGTSFQLVVWRALAEIPYGETWSYRQLAAKVGKPNAQRAVGLANGRNPLPIIVPCHRVIGANGALTGFGGGVSVKRLLLDLEQGRAPTRR